MIKIYCPKCKGKQEITDSPDGVPPGVTKMKNGRYRLYAHCATCSTKIGKFLGRESKDLIDAYNKAAASKETVTIARAKGMPSTTIKGKGDVWSEESNGKRKKPRRKRGAIKQPIKQPIKKGKLLRRKPSRPSPKRKRSPQSQ